VDVRVGSPIDDEGPDQREDEVPQLDTVRRRAEDGASHNEAVQVRGPATDLTVGGEGAGRIYVRAVV
jgi:hypothetical protein